MTTEASSFQPVLAGQQVLIIGGGSRMGLATARLVAGQGAHVILSGRSEEKLRQATESLGRQASFRAADATDPAQVESLLAQVRPDHVVVTASASGHASAIPQTSPEAARDAFGRFWMGYHVLHYAPGYVSRQGSVTLLSGSSGKTPAPGYGFWGTLHGSLEALARNAALELAPIRVNVVSPGGIGLPPDRQLTQHRGQPEDVAAMILALLANPAVTNAKIDVDGGERTGHWSGG